jgi:hypothetical protein
MGGHEGDCGDGAASEYGPWIWNAYRAYNELVRERVKKAFEAREGPWLDQVAKVLVDLVDARWEGGRAGQQKEEELLKKLSELLKQ